MARTSITTARYNPFTMEELYSPVLRATEEHMKQQEKYDELANQAAVWKYRLPENSEARKIYDNYMGKFDVVVNDLNENGIINPSSQDNARALIRENPIPAFIETQRQYDQINDAANKLNPTTTRWIHRPTFDDVFFGNTSMDYVDLKDIEQKASDNIALVARTITQEPEFKKATGAGGQYFNVASTTGITDAMWQMAEKRKQGESFGEDLDAQLDRLNNTVRDIRRYSRIDEFSSEKDRNDILAAINSGLLNGSAVTSYKPMQDNSNEMRYKWATYNLSKAGQDAQMYLQGMVSDGKGGYTYDPVVAAQFKTSSDGSGSSSGVLGLDNPFEVVSFKFDKDGSKVIGSGKYTGDDIKKTAYKDVSDFKAKKEQTGTVIVPKSGWSSADFDKPMKYKDGNTMTYREALMDIYKEFTGIDYKEKYQSLTESEKSTKYVGITNENQFADYLIKHDILPKYNIAFASDSKKDNKATDWEMFIEEKSVEKKLAEQDATKQDNGGNSNEKKEGEGGEGSEEEKEKAKHED